MTEAGSPETGQHIVIMSGPAGSGRSTAIRALEDIGFEAIDNLPLSFLPRLFSDGPVERPVVIGIDPRNREFAVGNLLAFLALTTLPLRGKAEQGRFGADAGRGRGPGGGP